MALAAAHAAAAAAGGSWGRSPAVQEKDTMHAPAAQPACGALPEPAPSRNEPAALAVLLLVHPGQRRKSIHCIKCPTSPFWQIFLWC
uniref:Uncharacterized protein n=1 Tax=Cyanistes caeruleus TaxID=156563 RepID=A0A8C0UNI8_CYACU